jgi:hypothetical protein
MEKLRKLIFDSKQPDWHRTLYVFDFDDTLVRTGSLIYVENEFNPHPELGTFFALTPGEFAVYEEREGDEFDFSDFRKLVDPQEISWTLNILKRVVRKHGNDSAVILTARGAIEPVREFLRSKGLSNVQVRALGDNHPQRKSAWISAVIKGLGLKRVEFFDDSPKNVEVVRAITRDFPDVDFRVHHVTH